MKILRNAVLATVLAWPVTAWAQEEGEPLARCRAELEGNRLTTVFEFSNGYQVVGPWTVVSRENANVNGQPGLALEARLDRVVERHGRTGEEVTTPFPRAVTTRFEGVDEEELVTRAAHLWCMTILKVHGRQASRHRHGAPAPGRVSAPPRRIGAT